MRDAYLLGTLKARNSRQHLICKLPSLGAAILGLQFLAKGPELID